MGACLSCNNSSDEQNKDQGLRRTQQAAPPTNTISNNSHNNRISSTGEGGTGGGVVGADHSSSLLLNGMRDSSSSSPAPNTPFDSSSSNMKAEKKAFYARIPPLGRTGSDKKASNNPIKDNNNGYSESKINALYEHYKDSSEDAVLIEGIEKLCKDLDVKPEDFKVLVLAWKFGAEQMCRFTKEEFFQGMKELRTDNVQGMAARLPDLVNEVMSDPVKFKDLYRFSFKFGLDLELNQRSLPIDIAIGLWRVVFSQREPPLVDRWIRFLEAHPHIRGIPRDTWNMFLNLIETVGDDLSNYDDTEAWPTLFDDFVEYENDKLNQNTIANNATSSGSVNTAEDSNNKGHFSYLQNQSIQQPHGTE